MRVGGSLLGSGGSVGVGGEWGRVVKVKMTTGHYTRVWSCQIIIFKGFLICFYFMSMGVLLAFMSVCHVCPVASEARRVCQSVSGTEVTDSREQHVDSGNWAVNTLNCLAIPPVPKYFLKPNSKQALIKYWSDEWALGRSIPRFLGNGPWNIF